MHRTFTTQVGRFTSPQEYKNHMISLGYTDLGWQNGWGKTLNDTWNEVRAKARKIELPVEDLQWNDTGSHFTYVYHGDFKTFCSVDMGD